MASVYRHYDADGVLLYVGMSLKPLKRQTQHGQTTRWFDDIATIKIERCASKDEAAEKELAAIKAERPKYNGPKFTQADKDCAVAAKRALAKAVRIVGGQAELARLIGTKQHSVWYWLHKSKKGASDSYLVKIEIATGGKVTRNDLRPDVFGGG